jgi:hypothetical protein
MTAIVPNKIHGPETYFVRSAVDGGQLVQAHIASKKIEPAAANSVLCMGVALYPAAPAGTTAGLNTNVYGGNPAFDNAELQEEVAVAFTGVFKLKAAVALAWGDFVKCGAAGTADKWVDGTDAASRRVAQVVDPDGIASGAWGFCRLRLT